MIPDDVSIMSRSGIWLYHSLLSEKYQIIRGNRCISTLVNPKLPLAHKISNFPLFVH